MIAKHRSFLLLISLQISIIASDVVADVGAQQIRYSIDHFMKGQLHSISQRYGDAVRSDYKIGALDSRLRMSDCAEPLSISLKSSNSVGHTSVRVSCQYSSPWSLYVPVTVNLFRPVVIAAMPVARGTKITSQHLQLREMPVNALSGSYFTSVDDVIGKQVKRRLKADTAVIASAIGPPLLVKRGDAVVLSAQSGALIVKIPGIALNDGHAGEQISVRNKQSKRVVFARVTGPGKVRVAM